MLRASRLYSRGITGRPQSAVKKHATGLIKRFETTASPSEPAKGSIGRALCGTALVGAAGYGGAIYYALHNPQFHDAFSTYVPGAEQALNFVEDLRTNQSFYDYRERALSFKNQTEEYVELAKDYGVKAKDAATDAYDYATDAFSKLAGQDEPIKPAKDVVVQSKQTRARVLSDDKGTMGSASLDKPDPILFKHVRSDNAVVCELSRVMAELASILNEAGLSGSGRTIMKEAESQLEALGHQYQNLDLAQADVLKALVLLRKRSDKVDNELDQFRKEVVSRMESTHSDAANKVAAKEHALREQFDQQREDMKKSFAELLNAELGAQQQQLEHQRAEALAEQGAALQRRFVQEVKLLVEQERAGRLSKLDQISKRFNALEEQSLRNASDLDCSRRTHMMHIASSALRDVLCASAHKQPFADELSTLKSSAQGNVVMLAMLESIPEMIAEEGVDSVRDLSARFDTVASEVRRVALVPEDGGFGAHMISILLSKLMFKKHGLVQGDDVESVLARSSYYLKNDDLESATRELNQLKGWPKKLAQGWLDAARRRLEVKQTLEVAETFAVLSSLSEA